MSLPFRYDEEKNFLIRCKVERFGGVGRDGADGNLDGGEGVGGKKGCPGGMCGKSSGPGGIIRRGERGGGMIMGVRKGMEMRGESRGEMEGMMTKGVKMGEEWWRIVGVYVNQDLERKLEELV